MCLGGGSAVVRLINADINESISIYTYHITIKKNISKTYCQASCTPAKYCLINKMTSEVIFDEIITGNLNRVRESLLSVELSSEELEKKHGVHRTTFQ